MAKAPVIYTEDQSGAFGRKLDELLKNPKGLVLEDLLSQHRAKIVQALRVGYTHADIVAALAEENITITESNLKRYLRTSEPTNRRTKSKKVDSAAASNGNGSSATIEQEPPSNGGEGAAVEPVSTQDEEPAPVEEAEPIDSPATEGIAPSEPEPISTKQPRRTKTAAEKSPSVAQKSPAKATKTKQPTATEPPAKSRTPATKTQQSAPKSEPSAAKPTELRQALQPQFQGKTLAGAIGEVLSKASEPMTAKDVAIELYEGLTIDDLKRAVKTVATLLATGRTKGDWQSPGKGLYQAGETEGQSPSGAAALTGAA